MKVAATPSDGAGEEERRALLAEWKRSRSPVRSGEGEDDDSFATIEHLVNTGQLDGSEGGVLVPLDSEAQRSTEGPAAATAAGGGRPCVDPGALRVLFQAMDKNHDGMVGRAEVLLALRRDPEVR